MFKTATSYLWGTQNTDETKKECDNNNNNNNNNNNKTLTPKHYQSTASLPDLDNLNNLDLDGFNLEEKKKDHRHSITSPYYHENELLLKSLKNELPIDIILDKDSKYKLSATSSISFLFNIQTHNRMNLKLSRYPYFIASNRNARYINKMDMNPSINNDEEIKSNIIDDTNNNNTNNTNNLQLSSSILSIINVADLNKYLDSLNLTDNEKKGILTLCEWVKTEKLSIKLCGDIWMAEIIITYFSSLSPTNPDLFGCWKKWIIYRSDQLSIGGLYNVNCKKLAQFFETGIFSIGFDNKRRPVWFINSEFYDDSFGSEIITKACVLWVSSLLWNLNKNQFDLFALRRGLSVYVNLSHWSINMVSWSILQSVKKAMVAYPFHLVDIYISNIPTFMYLIKQLAAKVVVPHAMEKLIILPDTNDYFEKYAEKHKTPICAGGTLKVSAMQWIKDRGFLDYIDSNNINNNK